MNIEKLDDPTEHTYRPRAIRTWGFLTPFSPVAVILHMLFSPVPMRRTWTGITRDKFTRWAFVAMALSSAISTIFAPDRLSAVGTSLVPLIFFFMLCFGRFGIQHPDVYLKSLVLGCGALGIVVIMAKLLRLNVWIGDFPILAQFTSATSRGNVLGMANNGLAALMEAGVVGGLALALTEKKRRSMYMLAGITSLIGVLHTYSRGSLLGVTISIVVFLCLMIAFHPRQARKMAVVTVIGIVIIAVALPLVPPIQNRVLSIADLEQHTARMNIWQGAIGLFKAHPIIGSGPGNYGATVGDYYPPELKHHFRSPHNQYLHVLTGWGLLGAIIFFGFLGHNTFRPVWRERRVLAIIAFSMMSAYWGHVLVEDLFIPHVAVIMGCVANRRL